MKKPIVMTAVSSMLAKAFAVTYKTNSCRMIAADGDFKTVKKV